MTVAIFFIEGPKNSTSPAGPEHGVKPKSSGKYQLNNSIFSHFMAETASNASSSDDPEQGDNLKGSGK